MTGIVEQAARVAYGTYHKAGEFRPYELAQALADAGLLREPARTVPTRNEIAEAMHARDDEDVDYLDHESALRYADAVLALLADQPTVDGARPWEHEGHKPVQHRDGKPPWCRECGYTSPAPAIPARQIRDGK